MTTTLGFDLDAVVAEIGERSCAVVPGVLSAAEVAHAVERLWAASAESQRRGIPAHIQQLDPNASNVRVFDLVDLDPLFGDLLEHPIADAVEGRVWHTSGANVTDAEDRPLLFAYYTKPFVRPQWNFTAALRPEVQARFSPTMRYRLGLDVGLNLGLNSGTEVS